MRTTTPLRPRRPRLVVAVVTAAFLLLGLVGAPVATAAEAEPKSEAQLQTFGIGPANADGLDRRGAFVFAGRPGTVIEDQVALVNYTTDPIKARLYAADAFTTDAGVFDVLAADEASTDIGSWVDLEPRTVTIPARKSKRAVKPGTLTVPFTVTVPEDATPGDHAAGMVVSVRTDAAEGTNSVVVDRRVGTRMFLQVAGPLDPTLEVTDLTATYDGTLNPLGTGTTRIDYVVRNSGNVVLSARQRTVVDAAFVESTTTTPQADLIQLLPGAEVAVSVEVPGTWPTLRPTARVTLVPYTGLPESPALLAEVSASTAFWAIPWTLIAIAVLLLLALAAYLAHRRRRGIDAAPLSSSEPELVDV